MVLQTRKHFVSGRIREEVLQLKHDNHGDYRKDNGSAQTWQGDEISKQCAFVIWMVRF